MDHHRLLALAALLAACSSSLPPLPRPPPAAPEADLDPAVIRQQMRERADGRLAAPAPPGWDQATFEAALLALADVAEDPRYLAAVHARAEARSFDPAGLVGALPYLGLHVRERDRKIVAPTRALLDGLLRRASEGDVPARELMTAPVLALATAATGDRRYLAAADRYFWKSAEELFAESAPLFGEGARGHGWALFALLRLLSYLPDEHPARAQLETAFRDGARALLAEQRPDGTWGELAATALAVHALAWGFNQGLLPQVEQTVRRAWVKLASSPDQAPAPFLLAGAEMFRLTLFEGSHAAVVSLANPLAETRFGETAEIAWPPLARALGAVPGDPVVVLEARSGRILASQLLDADGDSAAEQLLVSISLLSSDTRRVVVRRLARPFRLALPITRAHGRFFAEKGDDFAWENDRVAFRVYGPAQGQDPRQLTSGIDVWSKRVRVPVIDRWYREDYHRDRGEGLDFYEVGPTRGCGGLGLWRDGKLFTSRNFQRWRLIADGPVRVLFELTYQPWGPPGAEVGETKRISLDLGQSLSRIESRFTMRGAPVTLPVAVGVMRRGEGTVARDFPTTWMSYVEPPQGESGQIGCGVLGAEAGEFVEGEGQNLLVREQPSNRPFVYYAGAYWSKAPDFRAPDEWGLYLAAFSRRAGAPLGVQVLPATAALRQ